MTSGELPSVHTGQRVVAAEAVKRSHGRAACSPIKHECAVSHHLRANPAADFQYAKAMPVMPSESLSSEAACAVAFGRRLPRPLRRHAGSVQPFLASGMVRGGVATTAQAIRVAIRNGEIGA